MTSKTRFKSQLKPGKQCKRKHQRDAEFRKPKIPKPGVHGALVWARARARALRNLSRMKNTCFHVGRLEPEAAGRPGPVAGARRPNIPLPWRPAASMFGLMSP